MKNVVVDKNDIRFVRFSIPLRHGTCITHNDEDQHTIMSNLNYRQHDEYFGEISGTVDIESGKILNWEKAENNTTIFAKVVDEGVYTACNIHLDVIGSYEGYVPLIFECDTCGWGDYFNMTIDKEGYIQNWENNWEEKMKNFLKYMEEYA
jgi:hypothetical protein